MSAWDRVKERLYFAVASLTPRRLNARRTGPRVFANSVPKSGTNLLTRCLSLFPMLRPAFDHVSMNYNRQEGTNEFEQKAGRIGRGQYTSGHVFRTAANADIVETNDLTMVLIVRDPRDVVTSHFHYVSEKNLGHRLNDHYTSLPDDDARLMASIRGVAGEHTDDGDPLESIGEWMDVFLAWDAKPYCTTVRFEDLIGPQGGGDAASQRETVRRIVSHLDVHLSTDEVEAVADDVFSTDASTFRKGLIGDWENHFSPEHVDAFEEEAGAWLVEMGYENDHDWGVE